MPSSVAVPTVIRVPAFLLDSNRHGGINLLEEPVLVGVQSSVWDQLWRELRPPWGTGPLVGSGLHWWNQPLSHTQYSQKPSRSGPDQQTWPAPLKRVHL